MKNSLFALSGALLLSGVARAQVPPPQVVPSIATAQVVQSGATVTIPLVAGDSKVRLRLRNGAAYLDEETNGRNGNTVSARVDAEPGLYLLRAFAPGKEGRLVGAPLSIVVPGLRREAGVWLFNGSMWIEKAAPNAGVAGGAPAFVANLRRDEKAKLPLSVTSPRLLRWSAAPFSSVANNGAMADGLGAPSVGRLVVASGEMNAATDAERLKNAGKTGAALLQVDAASEPLLAARQLENAARFADAVVLKFDAGKPWIPQLWPLKMARRMAEETPDFDLPVFADVSQTEFSESRLLELYQNGVTGFLVAPGAPAPAWVRAWDANSNWLTGAVTLEDMGVLNVDSPRLEPLLADLRAAGRIPLVGQLPNARNPRGESNLILLDDSTTEATLEGISRAATAGNTLYVEGLPAPALYPKMGEITGTQVTALAAPREEFLTLNDPWTWGAINGREFPIVQRVSIAIKQSLAAQLKEQKGLALETKPRPTGRLSGDPNGWMVCPVGKGRIFWMPQSFSGAKRPDLSAYYAAVAGGMQSALIEMEGDRQNIRVALRATQGQTALLGLFNEGDKPAKISVGLRGDAAYVLDLLNDETINSSVTGFETKFDISLAPGGYRWLALARTLEDLDRERAFKRVKARLK